MENIIRPEALVLNDNALIPDDNLIAPPPNQFTHELTQAQPYYYTERSKARRRMVSSLRELRSYCWFTAAALIAASQMDKASTRKSSTAASGVYDGAQPSNADSLHAVSSRRLRLQRLEYKFRAAISRRYLI